MLLPSALSFVTNAPEHRPTGTTPYTPQYCVPTTPGIAFFSGKSLESVLPATYTPPSVPIAAARAAVVPLPPSRRENTSVIPALRHPITNVELSVVPVTTRPPFPPHATALAAPASYPPQRSSAPPPSSVPRTPTPPAALPAPGSGASRKSADPGTPATYT